MDDGLLKLDGGQRLLGWVRGEVAEGGAANNHYASKGGGHRNDHAGTLVQAALLPTPWLQILQGTTALDECAASSYSSWEATSGTENPRNLGTATL